MNTNLTLPIRQALIGLGPLLAAPGWVDEAQRGALAGQFANGVGVLVWLIGIIWQWRVSTAAGRREGTSGLDKIATWRQGGEATGSMNLRAHRIRELSH